MTRGKLVVLVVLAVMAIVGQANAVPVLPTGWYHHTPQVETGADIHVLTVFNPVYHFEWDSGKVWRHLGLFDENPAEEGWNMYFLNAAEDFQRGWDVTDKSNHMFYLGPNMFVASQTDLLDVVDFRWDGWGAGIDIEFEKHLSVARPVYVDDYTPGPAPVPEPGTNVLLGIGLLGLAWSGRKHMK